MATAKKSKKSVKTPEWKEVKALIKAQCDEFDKMIFGVCEDADDFVLGKKWLNSPMHHSMNLAFGTLEYDEDRELVILSYFSTEDPDNGYSVQKVFLKVNQISGLCNFLLAAYFTKRGRKQIEK